MQFRAEHVEEAVHVGGPARHQQRLLLLAGGQLAHVALQQFVHRDRQQVLHRELEVVFFDRFEKQQRDFVGFFLNVNLFAIGEFDVGLFVDLHVDFVVVETVVAVAVLAFDLVVEEVVAVLDAVPLAQFLHEEVGQLVPGHQ